MSGPIRVAQIIGVACNGGVESVIMNYYRNIDKTKVQFDFLVESESKIINKEEIESMGGRVVIIPSYKKLFKYNKELKRIFKENNYDIVHSNMNTLSMFPLRVAKKCGVKVRIAHSHSTSNKKEFLRNLLKNILRRFSKDYATHYFACGELAGRYQFGNKTYDQGKVTIIKNAIDVEKFAYNQEERNKIRKNLNLEDKFVIGHVGRFVKQKNHMFLIDVFNEVVKENKKAVLLLVGDGPLQKEIENKIANLKLKDTNDTAPLYSAMDVFVFPSLYEGLGMVLVEAQIAKLKCVYSQNVPDEAVIGDGCIKANIEFLSEWKEAINKVFNLQNTVVNNNKIESYDIRKQADRLENLYSTESK